MRLHAGSSNFMGLCHEVFSLFVKDLFNPQLSSSYVPISTLHSITLGDGTSSSDNVSSDIMPTGEVDIR